VEHWKNGILDEVQKSSKTPKLAAKGENIGGSVLIASESQQQ